MVDDFGGDDLVPREDSGRHGLSRKDIECKAYEARPVSQNPQ